MKQSGVREASTHETHEKLPPSRRTTFTKASSKEKWYVYLVYRYAFKKILSNKKSGLESRFCINFPIKN